MSEIETTQESVPVLTIVELVEKCGEGSYGNFARFKNIVEGKSEPVYDDSDEDDDEWTDFITCGDYDGEYSYNGINFEYIQSEGGGEGGAEFCETILKYQDVFIKVTYSYSCYCGYDFDYADFSIVKPREVTVTVYD